MNVKKCDFNGPVEKRRSIGGIHPEMFNEEVEFRFEVTIKGTDPKDIEDMLKLFKKSANGFDTTWAMKLQALRG
jgi:hypothetical protein